MTDPTASTTVGTDDAATFLTALYGGVDDGWITLFSTDRRTDRSAVDWFPVTDLDAAAQRATSRATTSCVWFGVATRRQRLARGRGGADDCNQLPGLWLDIDVAGPRHADSTHLPPTIEDAHQLLDRFEHPPSIVIDSGGGLQAWWLFAEPHDLDDSSDLLDRWHATWARLAAELGWHVDNVFDIARVMRLPGTWNRKPGVPPAPVEIVSATTLAYDVTDLAEILDDPTPPPAHTPRVIYNGDDRPGDEFNNSNTGNDVFAAAGWTLSHTDRDGNTYWVRPRSDGARHHAAVVYADGHIANYSPTSGLEVRRSYDPWGLHVALNHNGDHSAAARAWRRAHPKPYGDWDWVGDTEDGSTTDGTMLPVPVSFDDAVVGEAFGRFITGRFLHCGALGGWMRWDGRRWARDQTEAVHETCRRWVLTLGAQMFRADAKPDDIKRIAAYRSRAKLGDLVTIARRLEGIAATSDEFDRHHHLLVARNGVIDLTTGQLRAHDPDLRLTKLTDVDYLPDATHPDVDTVLQVVDHDVRDWLQVLFGYAATGHVDEDVMPVFDGSGSNGKTTLLGAVAAALGDYGRTASPRLLMKGSHDEHPAIFADLHGRRLVTIEETAEGGSLAVETMKALTGGSEINARFMRQNPFTFTPTHKLVVATNHRPAVNSIEHATWRRLRLVPFPHRYTTAHDARPGDRTVDKDLRNRLRTGTAQRQAMLAWIAAGAHRWHQHGLPNCATITTATDTWRKDEDVIYRFLSDRCDIGTGATVTSSELHRAYVSWCESEGRPAGSNKEMTKRLEAHDLIAANNIERRRTNQGFAWFGLGVREWL